MVELRCGWVPAGCPGQGGLLEGGMWQWADGVWFCGLECKLLGRGSI